MEKIGMKDSLLILILKFMGFLLRILSFFVPIKENYSLFVSFSGKNYDSNPRYFYEYMKDKKEGMNYVWAFKKIPNEDVKNCTQVVYGSFKYFIFLLKSKYWFFDVGITRGVCVPTKGHTIIHFCHATPIKKMGADANEKNILDLFGDYQIGEISDYILSQGRYSTDIYARAYNTNLNKFLEIGYPRTDCLFNLNKYKLDNPNLKRFKDKKVALYLPTMREWKKEDSSYMDFLNFLDFSNLYVLFKAHPSNKIKLNFPNVIDLSEINSINDLYYISDILITDYSSALFDYSITKKPILIYQNDYEDYQKNRGLYISKDKINLERFEKAIDLSNAILKVFNDKEYYDKLCYKTKEINKIYMEHDIPNTCEVLYKKLF